MAGSSLAHNRIVRNVVMALAPIERGGPCRVYFIDVRVRVAEDRYYYPDVVVDCAGRASDGCELEHPTFVVEVVSRSTQAIDRGEKLDAYRDRESLSGYLLIDSRRERAVLYTRGPSGSWDRHDLGGGDVAHIVALGVSIPVAEMYAGIALPPLTVKEGVDEW